MKYLFTIICIVTLFVANPGFSAVNNQITILYSNDVRGETEPCG